MPSREKLAEFVGWTQKHITGDEKGQAQIFRDRLFQGFGQSGFLDVGGHTEFRIRKADEDGGGTALATVLTAYGFSAKKDLLAQLLVPNHKVAVKIEKSEPVMPPGMPKNYPDAKNLVTEDCIRPAQLPS